jgi:hypothetical protein
MSEWRKDAGVYGMMGMARVAPGICDRILHDGMPSARHDSP